MKKILLFAISAMLVMAGCGKINDKIDRLDDRLSQLEGETIPTIDEQIRISTPPSAHCKRPMPT